MVALVELKPGIELGLLRSLDLNVKKRTPRIPMANAPPATYSQ